MAADRTGEPRRGLTKAGLAHALNWSLPKLDRAVLEPGFPILERGGRGRAWLFDLADVQRYVAEREAERGRDAAVAREAKRRNDPRERHLSVRSQRLELTAKRLARRLVRRDDAVATIGAVREEVSAWRVRLAQGVARLDIPDAARELLLKLVGDGADQFARSLEGLVGGVGVDER